MKAFKIIVSAALAAILLTACSFDRTKSLSVDLGNSEIFTQGELEQAAQSVIKEMRNMNSVKEFYTLTYMGDEKALESLDYCNELAGGGIEKCIVFESSFLTKGPQDSNGFNPNDEYTGYQWFVGKSAIGNWKILTSGY